MPEQGGLKADRRADRTGSSEAAYAAARPGRSMTRRVSGANQCRCQKTKPPSSLGANRCQGTNGLPLHARPLFPLA